MRRNKPFLPHFGNPARVLLNLQDQPRISIKPKCSEPRCIDPFHWKVIRERSYKYDDAPPPVWDDPRFEKPETSKFSDRDRQDIQQWVELIATGEESLRSMEQDDLLPDNVKEEIKKRVS